MEKAQENLLEQPMAADLLGTQMEQGLELVIQLV